MYGTEAHSGFDYTGVGVARSEVIEAESHVEEGVEGKHNCLPAGNSVVHFEAYADNKLDVRLGFNE